MRRAFKFRAYPTCPREGRAVRLLADHCDLYNAALEERREAWRMHRAGICYRMRPAQLREIRRADPHGHGRHSFTAQQTLRRLNTVFAAFYARADNGTGRRVIRRAGSRAAPLAALRRRPGSRGYDRGGGPRAA